MRLKFFNIATALVVLIALNSCKKDHSNNEGPGPNPVPNCTHHAKGTIEQCFGTNLWLINVYSGFNSPITPSFAVLAPQNLPANFQNNLSNVEFDFEILNDSVGYMCGCFPPPTMNYARKINICHIAPDTTQIVVLKPVIYLYPEKTTKVDLVLEYDGKLTVTYPAYNNMKKGWSVKANPDGTLINDDDGKEYQYLFWEGKPRVPYDFNMQKGYCVKGSNTASFLQTMLPKMGLTPKEYNDMIVFWLPRMQDNAYNLIHFAQEEYTSKAPLTIHPRPENIIRVFMAFQPSKNYVELEPQTLPSFSRKGFTAVEWGGTELPSVEKQTLIIHHTL